MKYMQKTTLLLVVAVAMIGVFTLPLNAHAATPNVSLYANGNGDNVQISVTGDTNSSVWLYYQKTGYGQQSQYLGVTDTSGNLSTNVSTSSLGITAGSTVYVLVNGIQSSTVSWPYSSGGNGSLSLSQTSVTLSTGQSTTISAYNNGSSSIYVSNNSNSSIASAYASGNQITITANNYGSTTIMVCSSQYNSNCSSIYVNVNSNGYYNNNNNYNYGSLSLSQSSVTVGIGQGGRDITISGGYAPYTMTSSVENIFRAAIGTNTLTVWGLSGGSGNINICSSGGSSGCATLYVTVDPSYNSSYYSGNTYYNNNYNYGTLSLSQSNVTINQGSSLNISVSGGNGSYYVSSNSNQTAINASVSGNTITLYGQNYGSGTLSICQTYNSGQCATLYVTVGSGTYYNSGYTGTQASFNGNTLTITGVSYTFPLTVSCSSSTNCTVYQVANYNGSYNGTNSSTYYSGSGNWTYCASENGWCSFSGTRQVRYGANGYYYYRTVTGGVSCSNATFGDPYFGYTKQCSYSY